MSSNDAFISDITSPQSPEMAKLYMELGIAISSWNEVEFGLLVVFLQSLRPLPDEAATAAYWSIVSFDAKLAVVNSSVRARFKHADDLISEWTTLYNRCGKRKKMRDKLAHSQVFSIDYLGRDGAMERETHLAPYGIKWMTQFKLEPGKSPWKDDRMSAEEIREKSISFAELGQQLLAFSSRLQAKTPPQEPP